MKRFVFTYLVIVALAACTFTQTTDLDRNRQTWQGAGITHYRYSLFISCFCAFTQRMPLSIEVRDGEVVSIAYSDGGALVPTDPNFENFSQYATIDRVFAELETDLNGEADQVTVTYDPTYGYPAEIQIDFVKNAADDELSLAVSNLEVLQ
ncbi:MAG TPA: DUF6174 domain-containing protein [Anaerolineales bacterium]